MHQGGVVASWIRRFCATAATSARMVEQGEISRANDPLLVTLLSQRMQGRVRTRALQAVLARNGDDAKLRARIRGMLKEG